MSKVLSNAGFTNPAQSNDMLSSEDRDTLSDVFEHWEHFADAGAILAPISPLAVSLLSLDQD